MAVFATQRLYIGGTYVDAGGVPHSYGSKISADGTTNVWLHTFVGPSSTTGIAVTDANKDGNGSVAWTGTSTINDPSSQTPGDHIITAHFSLDGVTRDYAFFYTFTGNPPTHRKPR